MCIQTHNLVCRLVYGAQDPMTGLHGDVVHGHSHLKPKHAHYDSLLVDVCRQELWYWDVVVLLQTFAIATALVFSTSLNTHYQLSIMLLIMLTGLTGLAHIAPFKDTLSQRVQVHISCVETPTLPLPLV